MKLPVVIVLVLLVGYVLYETVGFKVVERFTNPVRSDIGFSTDGWTEPGGYVRDLRYKEAIVDVQGFGSPTDFCRAVRKVRDPESLQISCALGRRDGMNVLEYNTQTKGEGFRFSRDDYWKTAVGGSQYCRILKDTQSPTGEWISSCAVAGRSGFKSSEVIDTDPPEAIQTLLRAYQHCLVWFRWHDDREDYAQNADVMAVGSPEFPTLVGADVSRGLQLNRTLSKPLTDYLRWGEHDTLELHQTISPRQIRAVAFWIWWDRMDANATIVGCGNPSNTVQRKDRFAIGIDGGADILDPAPISLSRTPPAQELSPELIQSIGQLTEPPLRPPSQEHKQTQSATYFFEIWDEEQRIFRLNAPMGSAKTNEWQHVVLTTTDATAWWPTWQLWINGVEVAEKKDGRLSPAMVLRDNFIGRGVRGCLKDFRVYNAPMTKDKIVEAIAWSKPRLHPNP